MYYDTSIQRKFLKVNFLNLALMEVEASGEGRIKVKPGGESEDLVICQVSREKEAYLYYRYSYISKLTKTAINKCTAKWKRLKNSLPQVQEIKNSLHLTVLRYFLKGMFTFNSNFIFKFLTASLIFQKIVGFSFSRPKNKHRRMEFPKR